MPRVKRPLAESDPNASREHRSSKRSRTRASEGNENGTDDRLEQKNKDCFRPNLPVIQPEATFERFDYDAMTNNKLRSLLRDRAGYQSMRIYGFDEWSESGRQPSELKSLTREEMILKLSKTNIDYKHCTTDELSEMLRRRHRSIVGTKAVKIERLRADDEVCHDTGGDSDESIHFVKLDCFEDFAPHFYSRREAAAKGDYSSFSTKELIDLLQQRKCLHNGSRKALLRRLEDDNKRRRKIPPCKTIEKKIKSLEAERVELIRKLEQETGWSRDKVLSYWRNASRERSVEVAVKGQPVQHICDYDWKDSHWASRSERELIEICERRGMAGKGPKATMIKWLETGSVEYEELYACALEGICEKRGLNYRGKRIELAQRLRENDAARPGAVRDT